MGEPEFLDEPPMLDEGPVPPIAVARLARAVEHLAIAIDKAAAAFTGGTVPLPAVAPHPAGPQPPQCPVHHVDWRLVPARVSKKSGKPYSEFWACSTPGCDARPVSS